MGVIAPDGDLYLINVDIDATQANQLWFDTQAEQVAFFQSKSVAGLAAADYSFIQKDEYVRVYRNADLLYNSNYIMYKNTAHANRWFFGFIKEIKWLSDNSSAISFETDVYQTWRWDVAFRRSFIERETVKHDYLGLHLLDEGLEYGDYVTVDEVKGGLGPMSIVVATTVINATLDPNSALLEVDKYIKTIGDGMIINNIYSGGNLIYWPNTAAGVAELNTWLNNITEAGASDAISAIFMCPTAALESGGNFAPAGENLVYARMVQTKVNGSINTVTMAQPPVSFEPPSQPFGAPAYIPRNKKLLSYPYCMVYVHNGNGSSATFEISEFDSERPTFRIYGDVTPLPQFKLVPLFYRGLNQNIDEALVLQSYPMCAYPIDAYKAWLAQNGTSTAIGVAGSAAAAAAGIGVAAKGAAAGFAVGGPLGAAAGAGVAGVMAIGGVTQAAQAMAKQQEASLSPPQARGSANSGSVNAAFNANDFYIAYKRIRTEWAMMLDQYFDMYGYKINQIKAPDFNCRERWYYVKMINPVITGAIPAPDMGKLKQMFENGVTLWNDHSEIGRYDLSNNTLGVG